MSASTARRTARATPAQKSDASTAARSTPARQRPTPASRTSQSQTSQTPKRRFLEDDEPRTPNYALRLTEGLDAEAPASPKAADPNFADSLTRALEAINAANGVPSNAVATPPPVEKQASGESFLTKLDKLPPIRLPVGPPIPWKLGLPMLVVLVMVMGLLSRTAGQSDPVVQLPATQSYPVQTEAPLFAKPTPESAAETAAAAPVLPSPQASPPIGVSEPSAGNIDFPDLGIKLVAVLALAYGSLMLLKKLGVGGTAASKGNGPMQGMRVVSSLALAPNRGVHVIRVPGGRTLLVGATPSAVNLIADLGELAEDELPEAASLFETFKGKIGK